MISAFMPSSARIRGQKSSKLWQKSRNWLPWCHLRPGAVSRTLFSHIFAGGYAAGYYSYLWADVLAADAFSRFEEEGIFNRETGQSFLDNILSRGGSEEPMDLFKRFRGREPQLDAMLEHYGIKG